MPPTINDVLANVTWIRINLLICSVFHHHTLTEYVIGLLRLFSMIHKSLYSSITICNLHKIFSIFSKRITLYFATLNSICKA